MDRVPSDVVVVPSDFIVVADSEQKLRFPLPESVRCDFCFCDCCCLGCRCCCCFMGFLFFLPLQLLLPLDNERAKLTGIVCDDVAAAVVAAASRAFALAAATSCSLLSNNCVIRIQYYNLPQGCCILDGLAGSRALVLGSTQDNTSRTHTGITMQLGLGPDSLRRFM